MAFNTNSNKGNNQDNWVKASGFVNIYLPTKEGKRRKLAGIPLRENNVNEARLFQYLEENPDRAQTLARKMIIEYQSAEPTDESGFDLEDFDEELVKETEHLRKTG